MRVMTVERNPADLEFLKSRWTTETHIFITSQEEFGLLLEDMAMLASLALVREAFVTGLYPDGEDKKRIEALKTSMSKSKYSTNKATYLLWVKYLDEQTASS